MNPFEPAVTALQTMTTHLTQSHSERSINSFLSYVDNNPTYKSRQIKFEVAACSIDVAEGALASSASLKASSTAHDFDERGRTPSWRSRGWLLPQ